ncbi:hypothetical protein ACFULT_26225 [Rhodococcus sp. NPDC057297]|uniref:hypothetical protein n=1 Tax=Rhodococcus sp. NPDC057297 TaxID=3346090 RepID=UPI00362A0658
MRLVGSLGSSKLGGGFFEVGVRDGSPKPVHRDHGDDDPNGDTAENPVEHPVSMTENVTVNRRLSRFCQAIEAAHNTKPMLG